MYATRTLAGVLLAGAVATGGTVAVDLVRADRVATLNDPITMGQAIKFHAPSHTVEINDNGLIEFVVGGEKRYGLTPSEAHGKNKTLFLDVETKENEATYKDVFGVGSELVVKNTPLSFSKVVSFTEDFLKTIPEGAEYVEVSFDLTGFSVPGGAYTERIQIQQDVWLEKSLAWDSSAGDTENDIANGNYTDVEFVISGNTLTKRIPVEWLNTAVFPIYTDAVFTFGTKELADAGPSGSVDVLPIGTDKAAICWYDNTAGTSPGECLISTVSGTDLTFGSMVAFDDDLTGANNAAFGSCEAGPDRWVVVYSEDLVSDLGVARVGSSTGSTINGFGTANTFNSATTTSPVCTYVATDKVIIGFGENPGSATTRTSEVIACEINADYTLTCGSSVTQEQDTTSAFGSRSCATLDVNKFICSYSSGVTGSPHRIGAGTVSGTAITLGATTTVSGAFSSSLGHALISPSANKFAVHWTESSATVERLALGSVSGTAITLGATTTPINSTTTSFSSITRIDADSAFLFYQQGVTDAGTTFTAAIPIELNFNTLTFSTSTAETVDTTTDPGSLHAAKIGPCKFLFAWEDDNDTNDLFAKIGDLVGCPASNHDDIIWWQ